MSFVNIKKLEEIGDFINDCGGKGDCQTCLKDDYCSIYSNTILFLYYLRKLGKSIEGKSPWMFTSKCDIGGN